MIFSVSNDSIECSLDFGPDLVNLTVNNLVQEMTISSQEIYLAAWSLLLSQRQQFLNSHLVRVPVTPNQQGTHEMRDEVLSSVGAQGMDTSGYQVSADLDDLDIYWEKDQLDVKAVFRPGVDTPFSRTAFDDLEMGGSAENPFCSTKRKTRRTLLLLQQQHQSLRDQHDPLHSWEAVHLQQK